MESVRYGGYEVGASVLTLVVFGLFADSNEQQAAEVRVVLGYAFDALQADLCISHQMDTWFCYKPITSSCREIARELVVSSL